MIECIDCQRAEDEAMQGFEWMGFNQTCALCELRMKLDGHKALDLPDGQAFWQTTEEWRD